MNGPLKFWLSLMLIALAILAEEEKLPGNLTPISVLEGDARVHQEVR